MESRFLLFNASAGSGKTFNLAVQYIALLVVGGADEFRRILAVTFTNKATAEMKDRILEQLYGIGNGLASSENYLEHVRRELREVYRQPLGDEEIRLRCRQALRRILHDYGRFSVSTIDTFFQQVLRNMAHELGLNARLQVELGDRKLLERAVDNLVDGLDGSDRKLLAWMMDYIDSRIDEGGRWDVRGDLKSLASWLFREEYLRRSLDAERNLHFTPDNIGGFRSQLIVERKRITEFAEEVCRSGVDCGQFKNGRYILPFFERLRDGDTRTAPSQTLLNYAADPTAMLKKADQQSPTLLAAATEMSQKLRQAIECYRRLVSINQVLHNLTPMALMGSIDAEVQRINHEQNSFTLANTPILLSSMVKDGDAPFIFEKMGTRYSHVMIDEFQDTSRLQWNNFRVLLLNALAQGNLTMVVGDIKQSIYRWRNGDWHTLLELGQHGLTGAVTDNRPLKTNRRSRGEIIRFNNEIFPRAAAWLDSRGKSRDGSTIAGIYADVEQDVAPGKEEGGYVRIRLMEKGEDGEVPSSLPDLCEQVERMHREQRVPYSKMAILLRQKRELGAIIRYFGEHLPDVQMISDEAFRLDYSTAVGMMVSALEVIGESQQPQPSPLPMLSLVKHYRRDVLGETFGEQDYCTEQAAEVLPAAFTEHLGELAQLPLYELCEQLYRLLRLGEIPNQDSYVFAFFDELSAYLRDNPSDIASFLTAWTESIAAKAISVGDVDGIRIVTIHTSKGLQYHTVFMPFCDWGMEDDKQNIRDNLIWCEPREAYLQGIGTLPIQLTGGMRNGDFRGDYEEEHFQKRVDELNALYVAFTRPECNLLVWGVVPSLDQDDEKIKAPTVAQLLNACIDTDEDGLLERGAPVAFEAKAKEEGNRISPQPIPASVAMRSYEGRMEFRQSRPAAQFVGAQDDEELDAKQLSYIEKGKLLHYIFSKIETADEVERVAQEMTAQGILKGRRQRDEVVSLARRGLSSPEVARWFDGSHRLFNECSILSLDAKSGRVVKHRPDRVMMTDESIVVVDYKFGSPKPEHETQVRGYLEILRDMHPGKRMEGWLWYVYSNKTKSIRL